MAMEEIRPKPVPARCKKTTCYETVSEQSEGSRSKEGRL